MTRFGYTDNLTNRLSTYNTGAIKDYKVEHVEYLDDMKEAETLVKLRLKKYRARNNKEWYTPRSVNKIIECVRDVKSYIETQVYSSEDSE